jgi:phospholipid transport system substrate-binding protein
MSSELSCMARFAHAAYVACRSLSGWALVAGLAGLLPAPAVAQAPAAPAASAAVQAPDEFIRVLSQTVLNRIRQDADLKSGDIRRISQFVDELVMPVLDFERMTALAVGRHWRQASPEQQRALMGEFRMLLTRTYSGALAQVKDHQIRVKPQRPSSDDSDVIVRSEIVSPRSDPIQLDYRLIRTESGWKIYDLNVLGVWLVESYRNQFSQEITARGIDGLIRSLAERNRQFAQARP